MRGYNWSSEDGCAGCFVLLVIAAAALIFGVGLWVALAVVPIFFVWNWIVPEVFPGLVQSGAVLGHLSFVQAIGVALLFGLLFGAGLIGSLVSSMFKSGGK